MSIYSNHTARSAWAELNEDGACTDSELREALALFDACNCEDADTDIADFNHCAACAGNTYRLNHSAWRAGIADAIAARAA